MHKKNSQLKMCSIFCIIMFTCVLSLFSQDISVTPKEVYVGDEAELRLTFVLDSDIVFDTTDTLSFVNTSPLEEDLDSSYSIKTIELSRSADSYILKIVFIPWQSGYISIDSFNLADVFSLDIPPVLIDIPQIQITSILDETTNKEIQGPLGPVTVPGTTYVLVAIVFCIFALCIFIIILITRFNLIRAWIYNRFGSLLTSNNYKKAIKGLSLLSKQSSVVEAKVFAAGLSSIIRNYLEGRFLHRFTAETTSSFFSVFDTLFAGTVSNTANDFLQDLYEICVRCDFLHYAGAETSKAPLTKKESETLIERAQKAFVFFEKANDSDQDVKGGA